MAVLALLVIMFSPIFTFFTFGMRSFLGGFYFVRYVDDFGLGVGSVRFPFAPLWLTFGFLRFPFGKSAAGGTSM